MYLGIDIGGTAIKYGVVDEKLNIVKKEKCPTPKASETALLDGVCEIIRREKESFSFSYVGVGVPGYVDSAAGVVRLSGNLPLKETRVAAYLEEKTGTKVYLGNDANCAALGEYLVGERGPKPQSLVLIALGTGVGGGIIIDGKLYTGSDGLAGEVGHMVLLHGGRKCSCGRRGCFEQYASVTSLIRMTQAAARKGEGLLGREMKDKCAEIDGCTAFRYAERGCETAKRVIEKYAYYLAGGIDSIAELLRPDEIVLSGGITNERDTLLNYIFAYYDNRCPLKISTLKNDAGFIGAALLGGR